MVIKDRMVRIGLRVYQFTYRLGTKGAAYAGVFSNLKQGVEFRDLFVPSLVISCH